MSNLTNPAWLMVLLATLVSDVAVAADTPPFTAYRVAPEYPAAAGPKDGYVLIENIVDRSGNVVAVLIVDSNLPSAFSDAARKAALQWKYYSSCGTRFAESFRTKTRIRFLSQEGTYVPILDPIVVPHKLEATETSDGLVLGDVDKCTQP